MTLVKVCGLMRPEDADAVSAAEADYAGMILSPGFRRSVDELRAAGISSRLADAVTPVGVFVNAPIEFVARFVEAGTVEAVQLHGDEDDDYIAAVRARLPETGVVKAFTVRGPADIERANASAADLVLLDNGQGTGETFDWSRIEGIARPFILAGGLGPGNVTEAVRRLNPYAVDMSSGVETNGEKDAGKIAAAVKAAREPRTPV